MKKVREDSNFSFEDCTQTVWNAKQEAGRAIFANVGPNGPKIHCMPKQMHHENQDVQSGFAKT